MAFLVGALDLTFRQSRSAARVGSECQIRSTSLYHSAQMDEKLDRPACADDDR